MTQRVDGPASVRARGCSPARGLLDRGCLPGRRRHPRVQRAPPPARQPAAPRPSPASTPSPAAQSQERAVGRPGPVAGEGPLPDDRLRPRPVRPGLAGRGPQRLRHPQRRARSTPDEHRVRGPEPHGCVVEAGDLDDPYTAQRIRFVRGDGRVDVDHVVALANAWVTGAANWDIKKRAALANDPMNLEPVDASTNRRRATATPPPGCLRTRPIAVRTSHDRWPSRTSTPSG